MHNDYSTVIFLKLRHTKFHHHNFETYFRGKGERNRHKYLIMTKLEVYRIRLTSYKTKWRVVLYV